MAYQVLARKYRPQRFADVAGQAHVTVTLMNALTQNRIAHGYIFSGHRGIGKTTIARILAMALNCRNTIGSELRPTAEPCEVCESCTEIRAGNAVDVIEIDAATNRGIDEIRELRDAARYRPARDRYKIYILDEAHQITDAAFNALLKTLEEPPDHVVFMMATTQPEDIPQTVRSRCQHFSFHAVKLADILHELRGIAKAEGVDADAAALGLLAEAGDGSMRDALSIMDQAIASAPSEDGHAVLSAAQIRELMGTVSNAAFERLLEAVDGGRSAEVMTLANELMDAGNSPAQLARQCVRYLRNVLMAKISGISMDSTATDGAAGEILQISPEERRRAARSAALFTEEELTRNLQVMLRTFDELGYRQEPRLHFELGLLKLVHLRRLLPVEELLSGLPVGGTARSSSAPARHLSSPVPPAAAARPEPRPAATPTPSSASPSQAFEPVNRPTAAAPAFSPFAMSQQRHSEGSTLSRLAASASAAVASPVSAPSAPPQPIPALPPAQRPSPPVVASPSSLRDPETAVSAAASSAPLPRAEQATPVGAPLPAAPPLAASTAAIPADTDPATSPATFPDTSGAAALQHAAVEALLNARQTSASEALEEAEWLLDGSSLRVQVALSKTMLPMVLNADADRIARSAIRGVAKEALTIEWLPTSATDQAKKTAAKRPARSGSAQAKAEQHPMVKQAQHLFEAEIRNVIDLSGSK